MVFLAVAATTLDWSRARTKDSDWIKFLPTIYPSDSVFSFGWHTPPAAAAKAPAPAAAAKTPAKTPAKGK